MLEEEWWAKRCSIGLGSVDCVVCVIIETGRLRGDCVVAAWWLRGGCVVAAWVLLEDASYLPVVELKQCNSWLSGWWLILSWDVVCCGVSALRVPCAAPCAACVPALRVPCAACLVLWWWTGHREKKSYATMAVPSAAECMTQILSLSPSITPTAW